MAKHEERFLATRSIMGGDEIRSGNSNIAHLMQKEMRRLITTCGETERSWLTERVGICRLSQVDILGKRHP